VNERAALKDLPCLQALQVFGQAHLEPEDFQRQVGFFEQSLAVHGVLGGDQCFEQVVEISLDGARI
jgi:hypothetical protein